MSESFVLFDGKCYQQIDGVATGFLLHPTLVNVFLCYHELGCLENCPLEFIPVVYKRYEDDALLLFRHG